MWVDGYEAAAVSPWETASGGQCAVCVGTEGKGAVVLKYDGKAGWFDLNLSVLCRAQRTPAPEC